MVACLANLSVKRPHHRVVLAHDVIGKVPFNKVRPLRRRLFALACCLCLSPPIVLATPVLDAIVVTGTRVEEPLQKVPMAVSRLDRQEIEQGNYRTTPEALSQLTGIMVQKTAHGHGSPFIRGLTGKEVLILIDGVRLNNSTFRFGPNQYLNTIDPSIIDHIEVVRGSGSVLYGSDALGGVINIITRKHRPTTQRPGPEGEVNLVYGSADDELTLRGILEGDIGNYGALLGGGYRDFGNLDAGGSLGEQPYTGYSEYHANAVVSQGGQTSGWDLSLQHTHQNKVPRTDKFINSNESQVFDPQERTLLAWQWRGQPGWMVSDRIQVNLSLQKQREVLDRHKFSSTLFKHIEDEVTTIGLGLQSDWQVTHEQLLTYGFEFYHDHIDSHRQDTNLGIVTQEAGSFPNGSKYSMLGVYLQDEFDISDSDQIVAGIRYSRANAKADLPSFGPLDESYDDWTGSLHWGHLITSGLRVYAGIAQGFRAPNLDDVAVLKSTNEGTDVPSPGLSSEKSLSYEIGIKADRPGWQGTADIFWTDFKDLIDRRPGTYLGLTFIDDNGNGIQDPGEDDVVQKFNVGEAYIYGAELDGRLYLNPEWSVFGNLSWFRGENQTANEPLSRIPPARALLGARWEPAALWLEPFVELVDGQHRLSARDKTDPRIPDGGTPGYTTINLRGGWSQGPHELDVALNNLADRLYKVHGSGLYAPGREIKLSYRWRF